MTLDLGPIKERAERAQKPPWSFIDARDSGRDVPALVAEVEALRAALWAEREACDQAAPYVVGCTESEEEHADKWRSDYNARRAPKIGGWE